MLVNSKLWRIKLKVLSLNQLFYSLRKKKKYEGVQMYLRYWCAEIIKFLNLKPMSHDYVLAN